MTRRKGDRYGQHIRRRKRFIEEFINSGETHVQMLGESTGGDDRSIGSMRSIKKIIDENDYPVEVVIRNHNKIYLIRKD